MQNKTHRLGRTCRNCTECRTDEHGLYCALDQSFLGWINTRNPRARAARCFNYQNKQLSDGTWKNEEVFYRNPQIRSKRDEALFKARRITPKNCSTCDYLCEDGSCWINNLRSHGERYEVQLDWSCNKYRPIGIFRK